MTPSERFKNAEDMAAALLTLKIDLPQNSESAIPLYMPGVAAKGIHVRQTEYFEANQDSAVLDDSTQPIDKNNS